MMFLKSKKLSVQELLEGEKLVKSKLLDVLGWPITVEVLKNNFSLIVENVDLPDDIEAQLISDPCANGRIQINQKYADDEEFDYLHEVIHYTFDVGIGKKVKNIYKRNRIGNKKNEHERKIDYMTAVALVPGNELIKRIDHYRKYWYQINETQFMLDLQKEFKCSEKCLRDRLHEVHRLRRRKLLPIE